MRRRFFGCAPPEQVLAELARGGEIVSSPDDVAHPVDVELVRTAVAASRCHGCPPSPEGTRRRGSAAPDTSLPRLSRRDPISRRDDGGKAPWDVRPGCRTRMCGSLRMSSGVSRMTTRRARGILVDSMFVEPPSERLEWRAAIAVHTSSLSCPRSPSYRLRDIATRSTVRTSGCPDDLRIPRPRLHCTRAPCVEQAPPSPRLRDATRLTAS